jgi:hypothetical protein
VLARNESVRWKDPGRKRPARLAVTSRRPPHPGAFLESRFLKPLQISQTELAAALGVSRRRVNELVTAGAPSPGYGGAARDVLQRRLSGWDMAASTCTPRSAAVKGGGARVEGALGSGPAGPSHAEPGAGALRSCGKPVWRLGIDVHSEACSSGASGSRVRNW